MRAALSEAIAASDLIIRLDRVDLAGTLKQASEGPSPPLTSSI